MLPATAALLVGLAVIVVLFVWLTSPDAGTTVSIQTLEDSANGVVYLEAPNVFIVATDDGPIALVGDAPHQLDDRLRYCPLRDYFEGPGLGGQFDRLGRYADGPGSRDMDRVAVKVDDGAIVVLTDEITVSAGRSPFHDPPKGPHCQGLSDEPGFWSPHPDSPCQYS